MSQGTIKRQVIVGNNQVAFEAGETVEIEDIQPSPQNPAFKYVVLSQRLQKRFQLSDDDIQLSLERPPVVPPASAIQPAYQQPVPPQGPPLKTPKNKKTILIVVGVIVGLLIIGGIISSVSKKETTVEKTQPAGETAEPATKTTPETTPPTETTESPAGSKENPWSYNEREQQEVPGGIAIPDYPDSSWRVFNVHRAPTIETAFGPEQAAGVFVIMTVTVYNNSSKEQTIESLGNELKLYDSQGREYSQSDKRIGLDNAYVTETIPPGTNLQKTAVFDTAADAVGLVLRVHGWGFSDSEVLYIKLPL